jgi:GH24 family phage-related lysozyme (muramidase)
MRPNPLKIFNDDQVDDVDENQPLKTDTFMIESAHSISDSNRVSPCRHRRNINEEGIQLIKAFEGIRLEAYLDAVNVPTIGYGHTKDVFLGMTITQAKAEELLRQDIAEFEIAVEDAVQVKINDNQFSALVSFCFNLGAGSLLQSTLLRLLNAEKLREASLEFPRWNQAGGQELLGLTRRRMAERALFLGTPWQPFLEYELLQLTQPEIQCEYVRYIQNGLQKAGFSIQDNGIFDFETDEAIKQFQAFLGLKPDGLVGPVTVTALGL